MTTAMIAACFIGLVCAVGILLSVIISAEFIYFLLFANTLEAATESNVSNPYRFKLLFSRASCGAKENGAGNPYRFKNASKLTAKAMGFIFFIQPGRDRFAIYAGNDLSSTSGNLSSVSGNNYSTIYPGNYHSSTMRLNDVTRKLFAHRAMQNLTTCL
jgi:hypothetical protein